MSGHPEHCDVLVVGTGPAGHKGAIQGAKAGRRVIVVERAPTVGGECVHHGTIPSKTLREGAVALRALRNRSDGLLGRQLPERFMLQSLRTRDHEVRRAHEHFLHHQLERNGAEVWHGHARFVAPDEVEVRAVDGTRRRVRAGAFLVATGSRPRTPAEIPVDHERVLDSDSILSLVYLPESLVVLGGGVIASEFASIFAALGVQVTMVDRQPRPLAFMDHELVAAFLTAYARMGGRYLAGRSVASVRVGPLTGVTTTLDDGTVLESEKVLCALGRSPRTADLGLDAAGVEVNDRGSIAVDSHYRTAVRHIFAAGDVIGPPALAAAAMEQGRRAVRNAIGAPVEVSAPIVPTGIYTVPEMASVGLGEEEVRSRMGEARVGRAKFSEIARGWIAGEVDGMLKLVADPLHGRLLGAHVVGEGATELVHVAQMAIIAGLRTDTFVDHVFNFPTMAEAYRVAALQLAGQRATGRRAA